MQHLYFNRVTAILVLLCLALLTGIWVVWSSVRTPILNTSKNEYVASTSELNSQLTTSGKIVIETFNSITERPLFTASRSPQQTLKNNEESYSEDASHELEIKLVGVARVDEHQVAMVMDTSRKKLYRLKVGDEIHAWKVDRIESNSLSLSKGEKKKTVALSRLAVKKNTTAKKPKNKPQPHVKAGREVQI